MTDEKQTKSERIAELEARVDRLEEVMEYALNHVAWRDE